MSVETRIGDFEVNWITGEIRSDETTVRLEPRVLQVLRTLADNAGATVSRPDLYQTVWNNSPGAEHSLNTAISTLRRVFGDTRDKPAYIRTVPRRGYSLIVEPESIGAVPQPEAEQTPSSESPVAPKATGGRYRTGFTIAGFACVLLAVAVFVTGLTADRSVSMPKIGIFIEPFRTEQEDANLQYLAYGMAEEIRRGLSGMADLVIAASGQSPDSLAIASPLDILTIAGDLDMQDDSLTLVLSVQPRGEQRDSEVFTRTITGKSDDLLSLRAQILSEVSIGIQMMRRADDLSAQDDAERAKRNPIVISANNVPPSATHNQKAYDHYLIGSYLAYRSTPETFTKAIWHLEQAVSLDAEFAEAHEGLGMLYFFAGSHYGQIPNALALPKAREALRKAIELKPTLSGAFASYADLLLCSDHDVAAAGKALDRALDLNPDLLSSVIPRYRLRIGDLAGMEANLEKGLQAFPSSAWQHTVAGWHYFEAGLLERARTVVDRAIDLDPDFAEAHRLSGRIYIAQGKNEEAMNAFDKSVSLARGNDRFRMVRAIGLARIGLQDKAKAEFAAIKATGVDLNPIHKTMFLAATDQIEEAFDALENAVNDKQIGLCFLNTDPAYGPLRAAPRFQQLLAQLNFK